MITEKVTVGEGTEYPLNGLLTLPDDLSKPVPAVVMVHGSGPSDMDGTVIKLTPFKDLAEGLAEKGIASIRYDKRTLAYARKLMAEVGKNITVKEETIEDAIFATEILKKDPRIDGGRIYILGHSMGAMLAPRIDAEGADVKGYVLMAGSPYRLEDIVLRQLKESRTRNGLINWIVGLQKKSYEKKFKGMYKMSDEAAKNKKVVGGSTLYYFKEMGEKTAVDYLEKNEKPCLILQGERDFQVLAKDDYARFKKLLSRRPNTVFKLYPGLNHCFVEAIYYNIMQASDEYGKERHIEANVIGDIANFIKGRS